MVATAIAAEQTLAIPPAASRPYLVASTAPRLRFHEAASTAPLVRKPVASGPPVAAASAPQMAEVALANDHAAASTPPMPLPESVPSASSPAAEKAEPAPTSKPLPILPDDTRRRVQSQDFLPLFHFPGSGGSSEDVTVLPSVPTPPTPGTLPASSATYRVQ